MPYSFNPLSGRFDYYEVNCIDIATGADVDTGTDNSKYVTALAMEDSSYIKDSGTYNINTTGNVNAQYFIGSLEPFEIQMLS